MTGPVASWATEGGTPHWGGVGVSAQVVRQLAAQLWRVAEVCKSHSPGECVLDSRLVNLKLGYNTGCQNKGLRTLRNETLCPLVQT